MVGAPLNGVDFPQRRPHPLIRQTLRLAPPACQLLLLFTKTLAELGLEFRELMHEALRELLLFGRETGGHPRSLRGSPGIQLRDRRLAALTKLSELGRDRGVQALREHALLFCGELLAPPVELLESLGQRFALETLHEGQPVIGGQDGRSGRRDRGRYE